VDDFLEQWGVEILLVDQKCIRNICVGKLIIDLVPSLWINIKSQIRLALNEYFLVSKIMIFFEKCNRLYNFISALYNIVIIVKCML